MNGSTRYVVLCVWFLSLGVFARFLCDVAQGLCFFPFYDQTLFRFRDIHLKKFIHQRQTFGWVGGFFTGKTMHTLGRGRTAWKMVSS